MNFCFHSNANYMVHGLNGAQFIGVQIRSDRIRSHFGTKIFISDWIGLIKFFFLFGSDFVIRNKMN